MDGFVDRLQQDYSSIVIVLGEEVLYNAHRSGISKNILTSYDTRKYIVIAVE